MTSFRRGISAAASLAVLSAGSLTLVSAPAGAASVDPKFCEAMASANQTQMLVAFATGFIDSTDALNGSDASSSSDAGKKSPLTAKQASSVARLLLAPKTGAAYVEAGKHTSGKFSKVLTEIGVYMQSAEGILKKAGLNDGAIKKLRNLDVTAVSKASGVDELAGKKLTDTQLLALGKSGEKWSKTGDAKFSKLQRDTALTAEADKALARCAPTDGAGKPVKDACVLFTPPVLAALTGATTDDASSDDNAPLARTCDLSVGAGSLSLSVTTAKMQAPGMKSLKGATKVKGLGSAAAITDGFGSASSSNFSFSTSGKTIWVTSKSTAFTLSLKKADPNDLYKDLPITDEEITTLAKLIAKQLKI
ncbi:MAG: hypothetical protein WBD02_00280 [Acidimicrobiia bacterium]